MEQKTMYLSFYNTPGHGYLKVPKKFIKKHLPEIIEKISEYSGQDLEHVYLEEDLDYSIFLRAIEAKSIQINISSEHIDDFSIKHNYKAETFHFTFETGEKFKCDGDEHTVYTVTSRKNGKILVCDDRGKKFNIPKSNPFEYVKAIVSNKDGQTLLNL